MKERAVYSIMVLVLVLGMALTLATPVGAATVTFTGDVPTDFTGAGILIIPDPGGVGDVGLPSNATAPYIPSGTVSGWDMVDLRLTYDAGTDTLYVGINTYGIAGDADGDGLPGNTSAWLSARGGTDHANLASTESIAVYFDFDKDSQPLEVPPVWDFEVIAGVPAGRDVTGFTVANFTGPYNPANNFGANLTGHIGSYYANPSAADPDFEFTILNFSTLPGQDASVGGFIVGAFLGSIEDDGIGEDYLVYQQNPHTIATIASSAPAVVSGGSVTLTVTEQNPAGPYSMNLTNPQVAVTKNGAPLATLVWPPTSGDVADSGVLNVGETWTWTLGSGPITTATTFVARGSGIAPGDFPVTYLTDPLEEDDVIVNSIAPNTTTTIAASATLVPYGSSVLLSVNETNTGDDPLTNPYVEVRQGATLIATLNKASPYYAGGDTGNDGILGVGENWRWTNIPSNAITGATTFEAKGFGTDSLGNPVTYPAYPSERATVDVNTIQPNTITTIAASATLIPYGGSVLLSVNETNTGDDPLTNPYVLVNPGGYNLTKTSPYYAGGDTGNDGILGVGENWRWTNIPSGAITAATTFVAVGFGTDSLGNVITYPGDLDERDEVTVNTIQPNTVTTIIASAAWVDPGDSVSLNVTEYNSGGDPLTNCYVEVRQGATLIATLNKASPYYAGGDISNPDVLDPGETWRWNNIPSNPITATTTFEAKGFGTDSLGNPVSYPAYPTERATVRVDVRGEGCLEICKFQDANVNGMWDPGEPWLSGWRFRVKGPDGYDRWVTTGPDGCVVLIDLLSGTYTVTEELKAGWYNTKPGGDPPYEQDVIVGISPDCARVEFGNREEIKDIPPMVPAMNKWGIIAMITVFAGLVVWTVRRKRLASRMS